MSRLHRSPMILILLLFYFPENLGESVPSLGLRLVSTSTHDCLDWTLTYECTVMGYLSGTIVWTGTAPNCPNDEMLLVHRYFPHQDVIFESCNGTIVAQSLSVQDNLYTSQLSVTVTHEAAGKTIMCFYDDDIITNASQFSTQIPGLLQIPSPNNLHISNANFILKEFTFSWSSVFSDCPAIHYNILASSNCGSCPTTTNYTNVTCTDIYVETDGSTCIFALQTVVGGSIIGNTSDPLVISTASPACTCIIPISSLAAALVIVVMISITVVVIISVRSKAKIKAALEQLSVAERTIHMDPMYEDVTGPLSSASAINTKDNVAYGHKQFKYIQYEDNAL